MRILLVDDERTVREPLKRFLEKNGFTVETAVNGIIALRLIGQDRPDLVIST